MGFRNPLPPPCLLLQPCILFLPTFFLFVVPFKHSHKHIAHIRQGWVRTGGRGGLRPRGAKHAANVIMSLAIEPRYTCWGQNEYSPLSSRLLNMQSRFTKPHPHRGRPITDALPECRSRGCHKSLSQSISITSPISLATFELLYTTVATHR